MSVHYNHCYLNGTSQSGLFLQGQILTSIFKCHFALILSFFLLKNYGIAVFSESIKSHPPDSRAWFNFLFSLLSFCITKLSMTISHFCQWCTVIYVLSIHVAIYISHSPFNRLVMTFQERERNVLATPTCLWLFFRLLKTCELINCPIKYTDAEHFLYCCLLNLLL